MVKESSKIQSSPLNSEFSLWKTLRNYFCIYFLELDSPFTEKCQYILYCLLRASTYQMLGMWQILFFVHYTD